MVNNISYAGRLCWDIEQNRWWDVKENPPTMNGRYLVTNGRCECLAFWKDDRFECEHVMNIMKWKIFSALQNNLWKSVSKRRLSRLRKLPSRDFINVMEDVPTEYDLCQLVGENGKTCMGWRVGGRHYDGLNIKRIDNVVAWRKANHEQS